MSQFHTILTDVGKAKVANSALLNKKLILKTLKVGDGKGSYYNPSESQTDLVNEVYSCAISSIEVHPKNPNWIIAIGIIPGSIGGFYIREVGLFDDEGDMVAIGKYPESYKPSLDDGATNDLRIRTIFEVSNVDSITLEVNPSVIFATKEDIDDLQKKIDLNTSSLKEKANKENIVNNFTTTEEGYIADARALKFINDNINNKFQVLKKNDTNYTFTLKVSQSTLNKPLLIYGASSACFFGIASFNGNNTVIWSEIFNKTNLTITVTVDGNTLTVTTSNKFYGSVCLIDLVG